MRIIILGITLLFSCPTTLWAAEPATNTQVIDPSQPQLPQGVLPALGGLVSSIISATTSKLGIVASSQTPSSIIQPINVYPPGTQPNDNTAPTVQCNVNIDNRHQVNAQANNTNTVHANFNNLLQQNTYHINPKELVSSGSSFVRQNKKRVLLSTVATTYAGINLYLLKGYYFITHQAVWASWKKHIKTEELFAIPPSELQKNLREDIFSRYFTKGLTSYLMFMKAVENEEKQISRYMRLGKGIQKSRLMRIFLGINNKKIDEARIKQERLKTVKNLFISWAAEQKSFKKV